MQYAMLFEIQAEVAPGFPFNKALDFQNRKLCQNLRNRQA